MQDIAILAVRKDSFAAQVVSFFTWSKWNHVAVRIGDKVYEMQPQGLRYVNIEYYEMICEFKELNTPQIDVEKAKVFMEKNKDKAYDWYRTLGWPLAFLFESDIEDEYNCVDLAFELWESEGIILWEGRNLSPAAVHKELGEYGRAD